MNIIYGYARVSAKTQRLDRQITNIQNAFPDVKRIYTEKFTGTNADNRTEISKFEKESKNRRYNRIW